MGDPVGRKCLRGADHVSRMPERAADRDAAFDNEAAAIDAAASPDDDWATAVTAATGQPTSDDGADAETDTSRRGASGGAAHGSRAARAGSRPATARATFSTAHSGSFRGLDHSE